MSRPYSTLLGHVTREVSGDVVLYECQPGLRTIVRDLLLHNRTTSEAQFTVYYSSGGADYLLSEVKVAQFAPYHLELRQVLPPDGIIHCFCAAAAWTCLITGYELAEVA